MCCRLRIVMTDLLETRLERLGRSPPIIRRVPSVTPGCTFYVNRRDGTRVREDNTSTGPRHEPTRQKAAARSVPRDAARHRGARAGAARPALAGRARPDARARGALP